MSKGRVFAIAAAALVAGLALGSFGLASAAPSNAGTGAGAGLRLMAGRTGQSLADIVAKLTGITADQVRTDRQAGKSFTEIAATKNVSADKVVSTALEARKAALDAAVKSGRMTQAQADTAYANMKTRITVNVGSTTPGCNGSGNCGGAGGGACGMGGGGRGACGGACGAAATN
jgi:hypothetical protein